MGWFAGDLIPANESLPGRVDCRRIRQQVKHVLEPGEFARSSIRRHAQAVLLDGSRCDNPEFEEVLVERYEGRGRGPAKSQVPTWRPRAGRDELGSCAEVCWYRLAIQVATPDLGRCFPCSWPHPRGQANFDHGRQPTRGIVGPIPGDWLFVAEQRTQAARARRRLPVSTVQGSAPVPPPATCKRLLFQEAD
jgi:hypothetical protein